MRILKLVFLTLALSTCRTVVEPPSKSALNSQNGTPLSHELAGSTQLGGHGMIVFGKDTMYMYHLPMWQGLHAWQIVLEVKLDAASLALYHSDRNAGSKLNSFSPQPFALASLAPGFTYRGKLFHGHFEQGGTPLGAATSTVTVKRIVMVTPLNPNLPELAVPTFRLFGNGTEWYAAHVASKRPNFDQVLQIDPVAGVINDDSLAAGVVITTPGRSDGLSQRLLGGQSANAQLPGEQALPLNVVTEVYFSTSDLGQ